jgi:hypothetical protein
MGLEHWTRPFSKLSQECKLVMPAMKAGELEVHLDME